MNEIIQNSLVKQSRFGVSVKERKAGRSSGVSLKKKKKTNLLLMVKSLAPGWNACTAALKTVVRVVVDSVILLKPA